MNPILRKLSRDVPAMIGLAIVVAVLFLAIFGPLLAPFPEDAAASHLARRLKPPTALYPFGTDNLGRDIFSRVILGARGVLRVALTVVFVAMAIGVPLGLISGYRGGWLSEVIMRVTDAVLAIPQLVLALALAQLLTPSLESAMLALSLTYWPFFTRIVYAETRRLSTSLFVDALRGIGASGTRILFLHILPNVISPVIVRATIGLGFTILVAAVLGFLGMGATPPAPDWGLTIAESRTYLPTAWWYATFPGLAILLTVMGFNLLGDGLRDLVDPRLRAFAMIPILSVRDLKVSIRGDEGIAAILDNVGLTIEAGRILGVVGESGCGKSTLIRAIMGILPRTARIESGTITFEGENLLVFSENELNQRIRGSRIGFIPQDPLLALNPVFKVGTQLLEIMRDHAPDNGLRGRACTRAHIARLVGLLRRMQVPDPEAALERYPHQFSGGQRQRLLITAALACSPSLVIADEPTTALDVTTQNQILLLLRELVSEFNLSMLFVTHDFGVVAELCDDLCVIYAGQSVEAGSVDAVLGAPAHPYTQALLECHPERATSFRGIPGTVPSPLAAPPGCRFAPRCSDALPHCVTDLPPQGHALSGAVVRCVHYA